MVDDDDDDDDGPYAATTNERCGMYDAFIHFIIFTTSPSWHLLLK